MTPKEKAKKLFDRYYIVCQEYTEEIQCSIQAKECALIAVDELLTLITYQPSIDYYLEVKQEIQAL
jgi:hypothetical protein